LTLKRLVICLALLSNFGWAQTAVRWDLGGPIAGVTTIATNPPTVSGQVPSYLIVLSGVQLNWCAYPANSTQGQACTNYAATYTSTTLSTACPSSQPIVLQGTNVCVQFSDSYGNLGVYTVAGTYSYTLTSGSTVYGPFVVTIGGGTGGGGTPGGSTCQVQYNNGGVFAGIPMCWNSVTNTLALTGTLNVSTLLNIGTGSTACGTFVPCIGAGIGSGAPSLTLFPYTLRYNSGGQIIPVANNVVTVTPDYSFSACGSNCPIVVNSPSTISPGAITATLTPCPIGVNGTDNPHYLLITPSGIDPTPVTEPVLITGGTCTSGASSGTITFSAAYAHTGNYVIGSATSGIQEAAQTLTPPGVTLKLMPQTNYVISAPYFVPGGASTFDGQWGALLCSSISTCVSVGGTQFAIGGGGEAFDIEHLVMEANATPWSATISGSVSGSSPTATLTIPTCPSGFWANIPNQLLWLAGTSSGSPTTVFGYGEYVMTTGGGSTCAPGVSNGTVNITQVTPGVTNLSAHDSGSSLSSGVGPFFEDGAIQAHFHDIKWLSNGVTNAGGNGFQIDNDQAASIDNIDLEAGYAMRTDADFQSSAIAALGPSGSGSGIVSIGPNVNVGNPAHFLFWFSGNDFTISGQNVSQNFIEGSMVFGGKRGGYGHYNIGAGVHFENSGRANPHGAAIGNPAMMVVGGTNSPIINASSTAGAGVFSTNQDSSYPIFPPTVATQTTNQYYYLAAHTNSVTGCTSPDCISIPTFIGEANINAPNTNNVTVAWLGWGTGCTVSGACPVPTSYDLLRVSGTAGAVPPAAPQGSGSYLVASGITPSSACNIHNLCTFVDNVASPTSYTVQAAQGNAKNYYPFVWLLPGIVSLTGDGAGSPYTATAGTMQFRSTSPTCVNSMEYFGARVVASFSGMSFGNEDDIGFGCPSQYAPIVNDGYAEMCFSAASPAVCQFAKNGSVVIAAGQTTVVVNTGAIQPWSHVQITEDSTQGTNLGVTCNTTAGRTYAVTAVTYGVSFTITSSAAPTTNPACLDFQIK
jgi:hypothetical protein